MLILLCYLNEDQFSRRSRLELWSFTCIQIYVHWILILIYMTIVFKKLLFQLVWLRCFLLTQGEIEYEIVRFMKGKKTYWKKLDMAESFEKYAFGISVDAFKRTGRFISSGIKWNQCSYKVDAGRIHDDTLLSEILFLSSSIFP